MKISLYDFQEKAVEDLHKAVFTHSKLYSIMKNQNIISFTAPTGAGKTVIMTSLFERIFFGAPGIPAMPNAVIVWFSDGPQLNEQSKLKIEQHSDKIRIGQCVTVDTSTDKEVLDDGKIYFINTQKMGKKGRLTGTGDTRTYTIWETFSNTAEQKADRFIFVIDEAHRGANQTDEQTTIMQKFVLGSNRDNLPPMPLVIGMTATPERFNKLITNKTSICIRVAPEEVRNSGLLKDKIIVSYPEGKSNGTQDIAILRAAASEWMNKREQWERYCKNNSCQPINPIFIVQVENSTAKGQVTNTDLNECLRQIEAIYGRFFKEGEIVHAFGEHDPVVLKDGYKIEYEEPSRINDNQNVKVVFFKESLSTGWDCPRAEAMMSFRSASDATNIAQLLGRMIRTPKHSHIEADESLNEVRLFLPHFDKTNVQEVINNLQSENDCQVPCSIEEEVYSHPRNSPASIYNLPASIRNQTASTRTDGDFSASGIENKANNTKALREYSSSFGSSAGYGNTSNADFDTDDPNSLFANRNNSGYGDETITEWDEDNDIEQNERTKVLRFINSLKLTKYSIKPTRTTKPLKSWFKLARFLTQTAIDTEVLDKARQTVADLIKEYVNNLKKHNRYERLIKDVKEFKLASKIFSILHKIEQIDLFESDMTAAELDIERQFEACEQNLGNEGIAYYYCKIASDENNPDLCKIDVIGFASDQDWQNRLEDKADEEFHRLNDEFRSIVCDKLPPETIQAFNDIIKAGYATAEIVFQLPENVMISDNPEAPECSDHFYLSDSGQTRILLDTEYERDILEEERKNPEFLYWLRNEPKKNWSLCLARQDGEKTVGFYPDFLIIRKDDGGNYMLDILEPHAANLTDNISKAKALSKYAEKHPKLRRVQLIRKGENSDGYKGYLRLDMGARSKIREEVNYASNNDDLNRLFRRYGKTVDQE